MQINEDLAHVVIEAIAKFKSPMSFGGLMDEAPFDRREVFSVVNSLVKIGLVDRVPSATSEEVSYVINKELSAYQITKAVELGLDIKALSKVLGITEKQRQAALALSAQAKKLKDLDDQQRAKKLAELAKTQTALPRDMIVETLERLAEASELSLQDFSGSLAVDQGIVQALQEAKQQALKALSNYQNDLGKGRGVSVEDFE